jgi:ubiquinol-cytochrome c reductase cytochrome b subunit
VPFVAPAGERAPERRPWAVGIVAFTNVALVVLIYQGGRSAWAPVLHAEVPERATAGLQGEPLRGATLFDLKGCLACHAVGGQGGQRGPNLGEIGDRLSADQLTWRILYGGNGMPAYGSALTPDELNALVAFMQAQRGR